MQIELIKNGDSGVVVDPTPILGDVKDTFAVSFILPEPGAYIALFRDENGVEYRTAIRDGTAKVPKWLLMKEQRIGLTVSQITDDEILHSWECQTLKVGSFLSLRKTQWQITVGTDDKELFARLAAIEKSYADTQTAFAELRSAFDSIQAEYLRRVAENERSAQSFGTRVNELMSELAEVRAENERIAAEHNKAIEVINNLSERLTALESNYDPTVIK